MEHLSTSKKDIKKLRMLVEKEETASRRTQGARKDLGFWIVFLKSSIKNNST